MKELDLNKKKRILIIMIVIGLLLILIIGAALAYMAPNINNTETSSTIVFNSGTVAIVYENGENQINAKDVLPGWTAIKEFSVTAKNNTEIDASDVMNYALKLVVEKNTFSSGAITYKLEGVNVDNNGTLAYILPNKLNSGASKINLGYGTFEQADALIKGVTHKYTLTLAFPNKTYESQSSDMGKQLSAHITIEKPEELVDLTIIDEQHNLNKTVKFEKNTTYELPILESKVDLLFLNWNVETGDGNISGNILTINGNTTIKSIYGNIFNYSYIAPTTENTEPYYTFKAPADGTYRLETWGAQGGSSYDKTKYIGGYGGYSVGTIHLDKNQEIFIVIGGTVNEFTSKKAIKINGGYNGGGAGFGGSDKYVSGGGGATHIAIETGLLKTFETKIDKLLIIAAGGGAGAFQTTSANGIGGSGGGFNGVKSTTVGSYTSTGATQTSSGKGYYPGKFGLGGCNATSNGCSGGGGGLYGGDAARYYGGGAGGSSYIGNSLLSDKVMYCFGCEESNESSTRTIATECHSETPTSNCTKEGNGYARITIQTIEEDAEYSTITVVNEEYQTVTTIETKKGNKINIPAESDSINEFEKYEIEKGTATIDGTNVTPKSDILTIKVKYKAKTIYEFAYIAPTTENTEPYYTFKAPADGTYKIETWGAKGGGTKGGNGAYVKGNIELKQGETIYIYVGGQGDSNGNGGYNGGGKAGVQVVNNDGGGGATDIRLVIGNLNSRIMVAAGGGGANGNGSNTDGIGKNGGAGGGINGVKGVSVISTMSGAGGTQTTGGLAGNTSNNSDRRAGYQGTFGYGGAGTYSKRTPKVSGGAGGGGGYYGGGGSEACASNCGGSAGGGSSYVSGHIGCVGITSLDDASPKKNCGVGTTDISCSIHYSNKVFINTLMIDGDGHKWTTTTAGDIERMPNPNGGYCDSGIGNAGNGYARIHLYH